MPGLDEHESPADDNAVKITMVRDILFVFWPKEIRKTTNHPRMSINLFPRISGEPKFATGARTERDGGTARQTPARL
jgi:hypothetical protein